MLLSLWIKTTVTVIENGLLLAKMKWGQFSCHFFQRYRLRCVGAGRDQLAKIGQSWSESTFSPSVWWSEELVKKKNKIKKRQNMQTHSPRLLIIKPNNKSNSLIWKTNKLLFKVDKKVQMRNSFCSNFISLLNKLRYCPLCCATKGNEAEIDVAKIFNWLIKRIMNRLAENQNNSLNLEWFMLDAGIDKAKDRHRFISCSADCKNKQSFL